ncbi:MAG: hypothetical protein J6V74_01550, partial [Bacteroidales bacterium]|nr:hypothetical protein [Bacteroidales bacterium]
MHFELTKDFIAYLKSLIEVQDVEKILECFSDAHPADIADILEQLTNEEANYVFLQFQPSVEASILVELEDEQLDRLLTVIPAEIIATDLIERETGLNCFNAGSSSQQLQGSYYLIKEANETCGVKRV